MDKPQPVKLIHLGQKHILPFGMKPVPEVAELIVNSQIKIANYIKDHPKVLVFLEGLTENWHGIPNDSMNYVATKILFPSGLPEDAAKLNSVQKEFLSESEGESSVRVLNRLGILKSIYRTISLEESKNIGSKVFNAETFENALGYMNEPRERAAMASIQEVLKDNPHVKKVILVFGNLHDFSGYCREYGFKHKKVDCTENLPQLSAKNKPFLDNPDKKAFEIYGQSRASTAPSPFSTRSSDLLDGLTRKVSEQPMVPPPSLISLLNRLEALILEQSLNNVNDEQPQLSPMRDTISNVRPLISSCSKPQLSGNIHKHSTSTDLFSFEEEERRKHQNNQLLKLRLEMEFGGALSRSACSIPKIMPDSDSDTDSD